MKCLAKRRIVEKENYDIIRTATKNLLDKQAEDIAIRTENKVYLAMLEVGLSPRTVERVRQRMEFVEKLAWEDHQFGISDYANWYRLTQAGIKAQRTSEENEV